MDVLSLCFPCFCDPVRDDRDPMGPLYAIIGGVRLMGLLEYLLMCFVEHLSTADVLYQTRTYCDCAIVPEWGGIRMSKILRVECSSEMK